VHCRKVKKRLSSLIDGELKGNQKSLVETHLRTCEQCRKAYQSLEANWALLEIVPHPKAAPFLYTRIKARLDEQSQKVRFVWVKPIFLPAALGIVVAFGVWIGSFVGKNGRSWNQEAGEQNMVNNGYYVEIFSDLPAASFGEVYFEFADQGEDQEEEIL
jgi:anti-sigma factor RsiW